jgi:periodic tryptophan protein 2
MLNYEFSNLCGNMYNTGNVLFTKDESDILLSSVGNKISIYDLKNGVSNTLPIESRSNIKLIELSPDSCTLVVIDIDGFCLIVNLPRKIVIGHFNFRANVSRVKISPDGKFLAVGLERALKIFEMPNSGHKEYEPLVLYKHYTHWQNDTITSLFWSSDSRFVLTGSKDCTVRLLNLFKLANYIPFSFTGHKSKIINAMFSEDNSRIFSISKDGTMFIWKLVEERSEDFEKKQEFERRIKSNRNLKSFDELVSEKGLVEEDDQIQKLRQVNKQTKIDGIQVQDEEILYYSEFETKISQGRYILEKKQQFIINGKISKCEINTNSSIIVLGLTTGVFCIYDINTLENKYTLQISDNKIDTLSINSQGLWLAFGSKKEGQLLVWEWKSESYVFKGQGHSFDLASMCFNMDSSLLASGGQDGKVKVWDTSNGSLIVTFSEHISKVSDLKFASSKTNVLVSASYDGTVRAYDLVKYRNFRIMTTPQPCQFLSVAVDFSGEIICAGSMDPYSIFVWSLKTGDLVDILSGHTGPVSSLAFSSVKDLLVSGSWDKTVKLWSLYAKKHDPETFEHTSEIVSVDLTPDDKEVAASTLNGEIYTWDVETASLKNIMDIYRDIWGGRMKTDRFSAKNAARNKHFESINYNLSGNLLLAGGNSPYVCIYDMQYQILIKKFCLTHNRSFEGVLHKLNSKFDGQETFEDEEEEEARDEFIDNLPGAKSKTKTGKKFNIPIKILSAKFSHTNRSFAVGTSEGIYIYSLDTALNFSSLNLDKDITSKSVEEALNSKSYLRALVYSFALNDNGLIEKSLHMTPFNQIMLMSNKLPFNTLGPILDYLARKMETDTNLQLYMMWIFYILKFNGDNLKKLKNKNLFLNLNKSLAKTMRGIDNLLQENIFTMKFITECKGELDEDEMIVDEETMDK